MKPATLAWSAAAALALGGLVWWALMPVPVAVEAAEIVRGRFAATVDGEGRTRVRNRFVVAAPLAGDLARIALRPGDAVTSGQTLAVIRPSASPFLDPRSKSEAQARLGAAEALKESTAQAVAQARARFDRAKVERDRIARLVGQGAATRKQLEDADLALAVAERDLAAAVSRDEAAAHDVEQARAVLARYDETPAEQAETWLVTSPGDGQVLRVLQESATIVAPGTALLEIGDVRDLEATIEVLSSEAVEIIPGAPVTFDGWGGGAVLKGRVRIVEPSAFTKVSTLGVEEQRVRLIADIETPREEWGALGDGFALDAHVETFAIEDALLAPAGALFRRDEDWRVFMLRDGRAAETGIGVIRRSGAAAAIESGLSAGDRVIVYPGDRVADGVAVEPR